MKQTVLSVLDVVRDESGKENAVRLVFEPKTSRIEQQELITTLLAHTSLETSSPINLTMVGLDGRPVQKSLRQMLVEWIAFRQATIERPGPVGGAVEKLCESPDLDLLRVAAAAGQRRYRRVGDRGNDDLVARGELRAALGRRRARRRRAGRRSGRTAGAPTPAGRRRSRRSR